MKLDILSKSWREREREGRRARLHRLLGWLIHGSIWIGLGILLGKVL